jgi:hypothetical protein
VVFALDDDPSMIVEGLRETLQELSVLVWDLQAERY